MSYQYKTLTSAGRHIYEVLQLAYFVIILLNPWQYTIWNFAIWYLDDFHWQLKWCLEISVAVLARLYYEKANRLGVLCLSFLLSCEQSGIVVPPSLLLRIITAQNTSNTLSISEWQLRLVHHSPEPSPVTYTHAQHVSVHLGSYPSNFCRPAPFRQKDPGTRVWSQASQGQEESRPKPAGLALRKAREIESTREKERTWERKTDRKRQSKRKFKE